MQSDPDGPSPESADTAGVLRALEWLDRKLAEAVHRAREAYPSDGVSDRFRGLVISDQDVDRVLARQPALPILWAGNGPGSTGFSVRFDWLADAFALEPLDRSVMLLALAPEVDLRYERLYGYLQDDVTRKRPTVDLALSLFCPSREERLAGIGRFLSNGALIQHRLIDLVGDPGAVRPPLLSYGIVADAQIVRFLMGFSSLDRRLASCARLLSGDPDPVANEARWLRLGRWIRDLHDAGETLRFHFQGPAGSGRRRAGLAAAAGAGRGLLVVECDVLPTDGDEALQLLSLAAREAWLQDAILYLDGSDQLLGAEQRNLVARLRLVLEGTSGLTVIFAGSRAWVPGAGGLTRVIPLHFDLPFGGRSRLWEEALSHPDFHTDPTVRSEMAQRFRFTRRQVEDTVAAAVVQGVLAGTSPEPLASADLFAAARRQTGHALESLATRIVPVHGWSDLVLPEASMAQLREICSRVVHRERVLGEWGFGARLSRGKGINALFCGASGTGKTMAAEIVAADLGLDVFKVQVAGVVSKYIGETERNLDRIFNAAEQTDGILLFDEADALFGKRSEVHDSHDRYANLEVSYLLQRMEEFEGIAILSTNLRGNLDQAFVRRLAFTILFPLPDARERQAIWERVWPAAVPLARDLDFALLAERFILTGGNIRNIALAAAFLAAPEGGEVSMVHVLQGVRREYEKIGKTMSHTELVGA